MLPYVFVFIGAVLAAVGGFWAAFQQVQRAEENAALSREIARKSEEISKLNQRIVALVTEQQELILGEKETFCQLTLYPDPRIGWYVSTYHYGSGNIYDVQVLIREVREDGTPVSDRVRIDIGTLTSNTWPWLLYPTGINGPQQNLARRYFQAQITQRNGTSRQDIVAYPKADGRIGVGFLRLEFNGKAYPPKLDRLPQGGAEPVIVPETEIRRILDLRKNAGIDS